MKKIVSGIIALACATSMFAVDFAAKVSMEGKVVTGVIDINDKNQTTASKDSTLNFWSLDAVNQYDGKEFLTLTGSGDKSGASVVIGYPYDGKAGMALTVRAASLWFKPIDMLKVTVGNFEDVTLRETMDYWKVPDGMAAKDHATYSWSSYATVSGSGVLLECTPIDGLKVTAGVTAETTKNFASLAFNEKEDETYGAYGLSATYGLAGLTGLPINVAASWRDEGKDAKKLLAIGGEYGNRYGDGIYALLNTRFRFENFSYTKLDAAHGKIYTWNTEAALQGISFDTMVKYQTGAFTVMGRFPVTIRGLVKDVESNGNKATDWGYDSKDDPSWMSYEIKASYSLGAFTPYLDIENDNAVTFTKDDIKETALKMNVQAGVSLNVGACALDVGLKVEVPNTKTSNLNWSVPFTSSVAF